MRTHAECNKHDENLFPQYVEILFTYQVSLGPFQLQCELFNIRQNLKVYLKGIQLYPLLIQKYVISKTRATKVESILILPSKQMLFFIFLFQDFITDIISFYLKITIDIRILHLHYNIRGGISGLYVSMLFKMIIFLFRIDPLFERNMV